MAKPAKRVFVDANTWISWGYKFGRAEASTLQDLVEHGLVRVLVTDLTITEIAKRFTKIEFDKVEPLTKAELRTAAKRYLEIEVPEMDRDTLRRSIFNHQLEAVTDALKERFRVDVRGIDTVKPSTVLNDYTHGIGLFGPSAKKDQFPDAFIFAAIAATASIDVPVIVLSQDGDFTEACIKHEHITRVSTMPGLLEVLGLQPEDKALMAVVEAEVELFEESMTDALADHTLDADDVEDAEVELLELLRIEDLEVRSLYRIIEGENTYIGFGHCSTELEVSYSHPDWDNAIWDSEDKRLIPIDTVEGKTSASTRNFAFSFLVDMEDGKPVSVYDCEVRETWGVYLSIQPYDPYQ
ncbi:MULTISPECIES: PIN domain-containing protein [Xanthomonas]|uniref:PIN domain-containing protein n=1 Tax=Xanthomonas dyei TaxID=743699 RepID=A0ABZ0DE88_9XANT|nr:PIN domain-containing protein [Xanthomonas dyei]WOB26942.1 PIN domain-containing protein [Xanthomonas dyei]WOB54562.1 PIN domain-containing protein [Xanthomonas dyei]